MGKIDIKSMRLDELQATFLERGLPKYRAAQVYRWLHQRGVTSFDEMTDLSKDLRAALPETFEIRSTEIALRRVSKLDGTVKYLFSLIDGETVESVLMQYHHGYSICISTQVGCKMGCTFCATGKSGFSRNLTPSEMLSEIQTAQRDAGVRISNVVLMGMGEPLDNYQDVLRFLELVSSENGLNIGMRHISLSTCGLVPQLRRFMQEAPHVTLSVSLHAPNNAIRNELMPVNAAYPMEELLAAAKQYADVTGRRVIFEYALIKNKNSERRHAAELAARLRGINCHVNLIPLNHVEERALMGVTRREAEGFMGWLAEFGVSATIRREMGNDIEGACGQLRRRVLEARREENT